MTGFVECVCSQRLEQNQVLYVNPARIICAFKREDRFYIKFKNAEDQTVNAEVSEATFRKLVGAAGDDDVALVAT